jgi:ACR3 family arsenite transporter
VSAEETQTLSGAAEPGPKRMSVFERYLTVWVVLCMVVGVLLGRAMPELTESLRALEFGAGSQINAPIAVLIWLMIVPMMMKIDFSSLAGATRRPKGLAVTLFVNWVVKPFSMFGLGWLFFQVLFLPLIGEELARQYTAGVVILAAAPARRWCSSGAISPMATRLTRSSKSPSTTS